MNKPSHNLKNYFIVLGIISIIIILIIATFGGLNNHSLTGKAVAELKRGGISIDKWDINSNGMVNLILNNDLDESVEINSLTINGEELIPKNLILGISEKKQIIGELSFIETNGRYDYTVKIEYVSSSNPDKMLSERKELAVKFD